MNRHPERARRLLTGASVALVLGGLIGSLFAWRRADYVRDQDRQDRLDALVADVRSRLDASVARQQQVVTDIAALFAVADRVTREEFALFVDRATATGAGNPLGVGYIARVTDKQLNAFVAAARADGAPDFTPRPPGNRPEWAITLYNEPADTMRMTWGFDGFTGPVARPALEASRDQGVPVLSERTTLAPDRELPVDEQPSGYILYMPIYRGGTDPGTVESRREALTGWVHMPFRVEDLVAEVTSDLSRPASVILAERGAESDPLAATPPITGTGLRSVSIPLQVHGASWLLTVATVDTGGGIQPVRVLAVGLAATLLLATLLTSLAAAHRAAQRRAEAATRSLSTSEARLRATLASAPDLILVVDEHGTILSASDQAMPLLGYRPEDLAGASVEMLLPESHRTAHAAHRAGFLSSPRTRTMGEGVDLTARRADGSEVAVEIALSPLPAEEGPIQVIAVVRDVSVRRRAEADQRLLASLVASTDDAVITSDLEGLVTTWNRAAERLYGWTAEEAVGRHLSFLVPGDRQEELHELLDRLGTGGAVERRETERIRRDGARISVSLTVSPLFDGNGGLSGSSAIARDISAERAAREALLSYASDLERSNQDLEEFAYIASHDLSEPLRVVGGYADLIASRYGNGRTLDDEAVRYMRTMTAGVERMRQLIEGLLAFSRLRADEQRLGPVDLRQIFADVRSNLEASVEESGADLQAGDLPVVWGDAGQITQLLQNLVANALKFRDPDRAPVVFVSAAPTRGRWAIAVSDNGIGVEPEFHDRIFAMFRRLHPRDRYEGTGIGLALCRRVVDLHGGEISVESEPGRGSTFTFTLATVPVERIAVAGERGGLPWFP